MKLLMQYNELKEKHPNAVILVRCGDFYETYEEDAKTCSDVLGITLTKSSRTGIRMAGFPYHALDAYLPRLIRAGKRVAICDQLEEPKEAKKKIELTKKQYELLHECVLYRRADNCAERFKAEKKGLKTTWYDDMEKQLEELKQLFS
jgi:DNA mismatch repair ATPase MutS